MKDPDIEAQKMSGFFLWFMIEYCRMGGIKRWIGSWECNGQLTTSRRI